MTLPLKEPLLTIETPEHIEVSYILAGPLSRAAAYGLDFVFSLVVVAAFLGVAVLLLLLFSVTEGAFLAEPGARGLDIWALAVISLGVFTARGCYYVYFEVRRNGQSPGKSVLGLRVMREGGYPITLVHSAIRNILRMVDMLPAFYAVGALVLLANRKRQRLGDLAAGTVVVRQVVDMAQADSLTVTEEDRSVEPIPESAKLPSAVYDVTVEFLRRRHQMTQTARRETARLLVDLAMQATGARLPPRASYEGFLAALASGYRQALQRQAQGGEERGGMGGFMPPAG
jgi:uncharacterized RDD family membrane protein YckC